MLVYQKLSGNWDSQSRRYRFPSNQEKLLYKGRLAEAKSSGGQSQQQVVATGPWQQQIPYINTLMDQALRLYQGGAPQYPTGQLTPNMNPMLTQSQQGANAAVAGNNTVNTAVQNDLLQTAGNAGSNPVSSVASTVAPNVGQGINTLIQGGNTALTTGNNLAPQLGTTLGNVMQGNPYTPVTAPTVGYGNIDASGAINTALNSNGMNPYTDQIVQAALRGSNENFQTNVLPSIRTGAGQANQMGGTRQGIAEGIAARGLMNQQGDIMARLYGQAFDTGSADRNAAMNLVAQGQNVNAQTGLQAQGLNLQAQQAGTNQQLQAAGMAGNLLTQGQGLSQDAMSTGTAQGGNLLTTGNSQAMDQYYRSLGLIPQYQAGNLAGYGFQNQMGLQQYGLDQAAIDSELDRYFYNTLAPYNALSQFQSYISGAYGSSLPTATPQNTMPAGYNGQIPTYQMALAPNNYRMF